MTRPLKLDTSGSPAEVGRLVDGDVLDAPGDLNVTGNTTLTGTLAVTGNVTAGGTVDGRDIAADGTAQDAHIAAASPHSGHAIGIASVTDEALVRFDGTGGKQLQAGPITVNDSGDVAGARDIGCRNISPTGTVDGRDIAADGTKLDGIAAGAEVNASANVGTVPSDIGTDVFDGETGAVQNFRRMRSGRGIRVSGASQVNTIDLDLSPVQPMRDVPRAFVVAGSKQAGATLRPNITGDVDPTVQNGQVIHDGDVLYPFMCWAPLDYYSYPHHEFRQMPGQTVAGVGVSKGWENGQRFRKGDLIARPGRGARWDIRAKLKNVGWTDAFFEFVLEPNPAVTVYAGANRVRFLSGELGYTDADWLLLDVSIELAVHRATEYSWTARAKLYSTTGALLREWDWGGFTESGLDVLQNDSKWQVRWRVDRIANLNTYDATYQGSNQGANLLRLDARRMAFTPIGFGDLRRL
jgi:hypothetical protein